MTVEGFTFMDVLSKCAQARKQYPPRCRICREALPKRVSPSYCEECKIVMQRFQEAYDHQPMPYIRERVEALARHTERIRAEMRDRKGVVA